MVTALEHCLRAEGACPEGKRHEVLTGMLLNLAQLGGSEEDVQLESLRYAPRRTVVVGRAYVLHTGHSKLRTWLTTN